MRKASHILALIGIMILAAVTFQRNRVWTDDTALWLDTARKSPEKRTAAHTAFIYYGLARDLDASGRPDDALVLLRKAVAVKPDYVKAYLDMAAILERKGDAPGADRALAFALTADPGTSEVCIRRGLALAGRHRYAEAIADFSRALALDPRSDTAFYNRAVAEYLLDRLPSAIEDYSAAIRIDPSSGRAYAGRAFAYRARGDEGRARIDFQRACDRSFERACREPGVRKGR